MKNKTLINYSQCLDWFYRRHPDKIKEYIQSISKKQIICKQWLIDELIKTSINFKNIQLYGGWFGYPIIDLLNKNFNNLESIINIDCDSEAVTINHRFSKHIFKHDFVKYSYKKVEEFVGDFSEVDLVINTSSEHMIDLPHLIKFKKYNDKCIFALQSNNMFHIDDHFNCVESVDELIEKSKLKKIIYKGKKEFDNYERYMVIGLF